MSSFIPEIFYKYKSFDGRAISMLANNQVYFASPLEFNDPFDCMVTKDIFDNLEPESLKAFVQSRGVLLEDITPESIQEYAAALDEHPEIEQIREKHKFMHEEMIKSQGILSLSSCNNSILMWSHYANYHKGFCIGFKNHLGLGDGQIMPVDYTKIRNSDLVREVTIMLNIDKATWLKRAEKNTFYTKYIDWHYEKEWRALGDKGIKNYPEDSIDNIIFGLKMPLEERIAIQKLLKNKPVKFFEATKSNRHFSVDIQPIGYL